jgi:hypothetical protein
VLMKDNLDQRMLSISRSRASRILKNLYTEFYELKELRQLTELKSGLSNFKRVLESLTVALEN